MKKILIGEKNKTLQNLLRIIALKYNYESTFETSGKKIIKICKKNKYDLILIENDLFENLNGLETTKILREELNLEIPIIGFGLNYFNNSQRELILNYGINDFLNKPFRLNELENFLV